MGARAAEDVTSAVAIRGVWRATRRAFDWNRRAHAAPGTVNLVGRNFCDVCPKRRGTFVESRRFMLARRLPLTDRAS